MENDLDFSDKIKNSLDFSTDSFSSFAEKVINFLSVKASEHNKQFPQNKVFLNQLKEVYKRGVFDSIRLEKPTGLWAIARVNTFLKMARGSSTSNCYRKLDRDIINDNSFFIDDGVREDLVFSYEQISEAKLDIDFFDLSGNQSYDFVKLDEFNEDNFPNNISTLSE